MRPSIYLIISVLLPILLHAQQSAYPCHFLVRDAKTHLPIGNASVSIDQIGGDTKLTDANGLCEFRNVPVGRIDCNISHTNYRFQRIQQNISSEVKNNSFIIDLIPNSDNNLLLVGKVEDAANHEIDQVKVEAVVDGTPYTTTTDAAGNYKLDIPLTSNRSDRIKMEFKKGSCRYSDEVSMPATHYLDKSVKIQCMKTSANIGAGSQDDQRLLTEEDKRQLRQQLTDVSRQVFVEYQRTDAEAGRYAEEIGEYVRSIGFNSIVRYGTPLGRGRFIIKEKSNSSRPVYYVNVCARDLD